MRLIIISAIVFASCGSETIETKNEQVSSLPVSKIAKTDFKVFWSNLGHALEVNDTSVLDKYLDSTVFLYGREDDDPKFELRNRDRIFKIREIYLTGGTYDFQNDVSITYRDFFLNKNALDKLSIDNLDVLDVEDFSFQRKGNDEWKLIGAYSDTKKLTNKSK